MLVGTFYIYRKMAKIYHQNKIAAIHGSSRVARNKEGCHNFFLNLYLNYYQSWLNLPVGSTPLWLYHKIDQFFLQKLKVY
jgi:hypothetical protein